MSKKIVAIIMTFCICFCMEKPILAKSAFEEAEVKKVIEEFTNQFEEVKKTASLDDIEKLFTSSECSKYSSSSRGISFSENNTIELVDLILQRRKIVCDNSDVDLNEYGKKINYDYQNIYINGDMATVIVNITREWNYVFSPEIKSGAMDQFIFELKNEKDEWKIENIEGLNNILVDEELNEYGDKITRSEKISYLNQFENSLNNIFIEETTDKKDQKNSTITRASTYNTTNATSYALKYALTPNPDYYDFSDIANGGDCTNFISQCLLAGGISKHTGTAYSDTCWYYNSSSDRSSSWTGAKQFRTYIFGSTSRINATNSSWSDVTFGDIIQLYNTSPDPYHSLIITGIVSGIQGPNRSDLLVCAHTANRRHVSLASYYSGTSKYYYHIAGNK